MRNCLNCKIHKPIREFYRGENASKGFFSVCSVCRPIRARLKKEKASIRQKIAYAEKNKEAQQKRIILKKETEEAKRMEIASEVSKKEKTVLPKAKKVKTEEQKKRQSLYQGKYNKRKKKKSALFKLLYNLRNRNYAAFKGLCKDKTTIELLGTTLEIAKKYLETLFYAHPITGELMTWGNYGKGPQKWQIDHKEPLGLALTSGRLSSLCHYTNLQPLWSIDHENKTSRDIEKIKLNKNNKLVNNIR